MRSYEILYQYGVDKKILSKGVNFQVDSRKTLPGTVFFALKGSNNSGEQFLKQVSEKKGVCAFVPKSYSGDDYNLKLIKVDDPLSILHQIAKEQKRSMKAKTIGITGSVGKTTTKDFTATILESSFKTGKSFGNANSQIGLPLSILNFDEDYDLTILEMGMSEKGNIEKLSEIALPEIALITKVGHAHAQYFDNLTKIVEAKAEIFTNNPKIKIVDYDLLQYSCIKKHDPITFSVSNRKADYFLDIKKRTVLECSKKKHSFVLPFQETSFLHDLLGAVVIARQLNIDYETIQAQFSALKTPSRRFEKIKKNSVLFINDAYNSNPLSLRAALENLKLYQNRKIAVIGPMLELGKYSLEKHYEIGKIAAKHVDILFTIGKECECLAQSFLEEKPFAFHFSDIQLLATKLKREIKENDVVLVKGSNAVKLEKLFELI